VLEHPVAVLVEKISGALNRVAGGPPAWTMTAHEQRHTLQQLAKIQAQLDATRLLVLVQADRDGATLEAGASSAADWAAVATRQRRAHAKADLRLADTLCHRRHLEAAMTAGAVNLDQARVIARALDMLPRDGEHGLHWDQVEQAEIHLVAQAATFDAKALEVLGAKIYEVIAPEHAEAREAAVLEAQDERAARKTSLKMWRDGEGVTHGRFAVPDLHGDILRKALLAISSPARPREEDPPTRVPSPVRQGQAFCELLERLGAADLPTAGGGDATVVVTMTLDQLTAALTEAGVATLDTGTRISAAEARRLACQHRLVPMVLDGASVPLEVGRSQRLHTKAQRLAMGVRDGGCTAEHCEVPAAMCHAHHDQPWSLGGETSLHSGRLLCGPHHRRIHDPGCDHTLTPDGKVRFHRRT
jgi:hypothetical protein